MRNLKSNALVTLLYACLCFPLFYFVYKYSTPFLGMIDFYDYYKLYENMDYKSADSPLNMRLVSSFFVYLLSRAGFFYDTACAIDGAPFSKMIYFNAVFFNYICVALTCTVIYNFLKKTGHSILMSFAAGTLYILGFGTIFFELIPSTDAMAVLLFAIILTLYHKKNNWVILPLIILILQREYLLLAMGLIALIDYVKYRNKYYLVVLSTTVVCFLIHVVLRKLIFETARYSHHTSVDFMMNAMSALQFPLLPFIKQFVMTLNIFVIYIFIILYKRFKKITFDKHEFIKIMLLLLQILALSFLLSLGNNFGRYFYILLPLIIIQIANEVKIFKLDTEDRS